MTSNQTFIIAAYLLTWTGLVGYVVYLARRGRSARSEHERVTAGRAGDWWR
ncbi:MAG: CcmD family protein [Gemmatimonadaceae bacterium]